MLRGLLPRLPILRGVFPRAAAPILPTARMMRPAYAPLTQTPRSISTSGSRLFQTFSTRRSPSPSEAHYGPAVLPPNATLSQRLKHLIKVYGWYALGVYLVFSVLDFGVAFAGINMLGAEYVSSITATVKESITGIFHSKPSEPGREEVDVTHGSGAAHGGNGQEGLYAMLVLAYTVHKTLFMPLRVGLTAAFTPRIVNWLTRRGWVGKEGTRRVAAEMRERLAERRSRRGSVDD
ncbi:hypothetical protein AX16_006994 [Volvariella volvacea WC 439]|nr:hypothetical protein AX16_006994 [Volvariella volvacea WC 439]